MLRDALVILETSVCADIGQRRRQPERTGDCMAKAFFVEVPSISAKHYPPFNKPG